MMCCNLQESQAAENAERGPFPGLSAMRKVGGNPAGRACGWLLTVWGAQAPSCLPCYA